MKTRISTISAFGLTALLAVSALAADAKFEPIEKAMKYAHKAPKGEKKIGEKIVEGTATDEEITKTLELYKAMAECPPPKGDAADFKARCAKLIAATEAVLAKKEGANAQYKEAVNCKACHNEHRED